MQAVGLDPILKANIHYQIVGAVEPAMKSSIEALATSYGVKLMISGEVSQQELQDAILDSDVVSCLRWPALEAASASAIEAMLYGKALIVTNTGFYAELPDSCALKINQDNEVPEIQSALLTLLADRMCIANFGSAAQDWASRTFTPRNYADQMMAGVLDTLKAAQTKSAVDYFCEILKGWSYRENAHVMDELIRPLRIFE
jgi:glycosyltransferase involved in cell wall biosynthesis